MDELQKFKKWAEETGHWRVAEAVDRYLAMLETDEYKEKDDGRN